jgi:hypothetical protein
MMRGGRRRLECALDKVGLGPSPFLFFSPLSICPDRLQAQKGCGEALHYLLVAAAAAGPRPVFSAMVEWAAARLSVLPSLRLNQALWSRCLWLSPHLLSSPSTFWCFLHSGPTQISFPVCLDANYRLPGPTYPSYWPFMVNSVCPQWLYTS